MPVTIQSAYFGDEVSSRNVTDALNSRISGGQKEIPVNSSIIPLLQVGGAVTLTKEDESKIDEQAKKQCGDGADQSCVANMKQTLRRQRLQEKETEIVSSNKDIVKGRRLTVKVKDTATNAESEYVIPEGQAFKPDVVVAETKKAEGWKMPSAPSAPALDPPKFTLPTLTGTLLTVVTVGGTMIGTFLYVYSIMIVYRTFFEASYTKVFVLALTAAAAFFPGSGFIMVFAYNFFPEYFPKVEQ
jgi:hypothetical protein